MKEIKEFIKERSKILFFSSIISIILFILILPEFLSYSDFINNIINPENYNITASDTDISEVIWAKHAHEAFKEFSLMFSCIFVFISLFNLVGYIYKKTEFVFISIGLSIVVTCMSIYVANPLFVVLIALATILNILGYFEQHKIEKR